MSDEFEKFVYYLHGNSFWSRLLTVFLAFAFVYFCFAFTTWQWNPGLWNVVNRVLMVLFAAGISVLVTGLKEGWG